MKLVDTHCHMNNTAYKTDIDDILKKIGEELEFIVNIGYGLKSSKDSVELAKSHDFIYATVGVHPTDIKGYNDEIEDALEELAKNKKVVAIGEIGLDYHWMKDEKEQQKIVFKRQLELAKKLDKPVVIHSRDAIKNTIDILKEYPTIKGIIHCYPGSYESAMEIIDNYYFGIGGVVTFKNAKKLVEVVSQLPLNRLLIETDSPYLSPVPFRGKQNNPLYVEYIAKKISEIKNISYEEVVRVTTENAKKIYGIL